ncbi:MAG: hypothetical protein WAT39_19530 [Planctomycetota bacterium]
MSSTHPAEPLRDAHGLARFLDVGISTVDQLRREGRIPFVRIGPKTIRYEPKVVLDALRGREVSPELPTGVA